MIALVNEFPTLDLDEFDDTPLRPAVSVAALERREFPHLLALAMPTVVHSRHRHDAALIYEHQFIDTATGASVRYVVAFDERNEFRARVGEAGPTGLWDRLVLTCLDWEHAGRPDPTYWSSVVLQSEQCQRAATRSSSRHVCSEGTGLCG